MNEYEEEYELYKSGLNSAFQSVILCIFFMNKIFVW